MWVMDGSGCGQCPANLMKAAGNDVTRGVLHQRCLQPDAQPGSVSECPVPGTVQHSREFPGKNHGEDIKDAQDGSDKYGDKFIHMSEEERLEQFQTIAKEEKLRSEGRPEAFN